MTQEKMTDQYRIGITSKTIPMNMMIPSTGKLSLEIGEARHDAYGFEQPRTDTFNNSTLGWISSMLVSARRGCRSSSRAFDPPTLTATMPLFIRLKSDRDSHT